MTATVIYELRRFIDDTNPGFGRMVIERKALVDGSVRYSGISGFWMKKKVAGEPIHLPTMEFQIQAKDEFGAYAAWNEAYERASKALNEGVLNWAELPDG